MTRLQLYHLENSAKNMGILVSGSAVKNMVDQTREEHFVQNGKLRTSCCSSVVTAGLVIVRSSNRAKWRTGTRKLERFTKKFKAKIKRELTILSRKTVCETFRNGWRSSQTI